MSRPEMGGISSLDGLIKSLSWLRKPFYHDDLAWQRFLLTARYLWLVFKGKAPPRPPSAAPATIAGETATIAGENFADVIIARARGVRS